MIKNTAKILLKNNMIHFLASDIHRAGGIYNKIKTVNLELKKYIDENTINSLTTINPSKVIKNEIIEIPEPIKYQKKIFGFI